MKNIYYILATYRPHQARQTVVEMMKKQIERRKLFLANLDRYFFSIKFQREEQREIFVFNCCLIYFRELNKARKQISNSKNDLFKSELYPAELLIEEQDQSNENAIQQSHQTNEMDIV